MNQKADWKKYLYSFAITAVIFVTAIYLSNFFGQKKLDEIRSTQEKVSLDILSSETQFSLLETSSCTDAANGALSTDLGRVSRERPRTFRPASAILEAILFPFGN